MEIFNNNDNQAPPSVVVEGMTSVSALINAVLSGKNSRRILRVLVSHKAAAPPSPLGRKSPRGRIFRYTRRD
jgi:hypothetical protein